MWEALTKVQVYILLVGSEHRGNTVKLASADTSVDQWHYGLYFIVFYFFITAQDEKSDEI